MISMTTIRFRIFLLILASFFVITACAQPAATTMPPPTAAPTTTPAPTATPAPTSTPEPSATAESTAALEPSATPLPDVDLNMDLPEGNPRKGFTAAIRFGCQGCHANDDHPLAGPRFTAVDGLPTILERGEARIADPNYAGNATSNWEYFIESVFLPEAYFVPGEWEESMSLLYSHTLKEQDLADILAWIATLEE